jgi:hypothetical protein
MTDERLRHRQASASYASFGEGYQAFSIGTPVERFREHQLITRHLAFKFQTTLNEPYRWMKEEHGTQKLLGQIGPIVSAPQMGKLVQKDRGKVMRRQVKRPVWQQHSRLEETNCSGDLYSVGSE